MAITFVKHFAIIFWSLFVFIKSINNKPTVKIISSQVIYSVALSLLVALTINSFLPEAISIVIVAFSCIFNKFITKTKWDIAIIASVIACAFSYALNSLSVIIIALICSFLFKNITDSIIFLNTGCSFIVMGLFVFLIFKAKRLKNGFPFLNDKHISLLGVIIALIVFQCYTIINVTIKLEGSFDELAMVSLLCIVICVILIVTWWRTGITKTYRDSLIVKENKELYREIGEKDKRISDVEKDNTALSRIIHSDNKLIPALENAVKSLCEEYSDELACDIIKELSRVSSERKGILNRYKKDSKPLPPTKITSLDITLDYMKQKAYENNIEFNVFVSGNIKHMTEAYIEEERLRTLTADLLENAIIAVKRCEYRNILFTIGICDDCYEVRVDDSGIDFEEETLYNLGKKQTTTHGHEGGSGIGMMEVFHLMAETGASLVIKKLPGGGQGFTKRVSVRFDGNSEYVCDYAGVELINQLRVECTIPSFSH